MIQMGKPRLARTSFDRQAITGGIGIKSKRQKGTATGKARRIVRRAKTRVFGTKGEILKHEEIPNEIRAWLQMRAATRRAIRKLNTYEAIFMGLGITVSATVKDPGPALMGAPMAIILIEREKRPRKVLKRRSNLAFRWNMQRSDNPKIRAALQKYKFVKVKAVYDPTIEGLFRIQMNFTNEPGLRRKRNLVEPGEQPNF
ncbi:MAG: hypothetical protein NT067_02190 [Candidatus Diapherotrites archaeon]|nr:hypothetical protein [Candidatus Diapherotrites archaeon]